MKKLTTLLTSLVASTAMANTPLDQFRALNQFAIAQDTQAMSQLLTEDFVLTHITGYPQPKAEWLAEVARGSMKYFAFDEIETQSDIEGKSAVLISKNLVDANIWGNRHTWRLEQKVEFVQIKGEWKIQRSTARLF